MLQIVINNLEGVDNKIAKDLLSVFKSEQSKVEEGFYESTIFGSQAEYSSTMSIFNSKMISSVNRKLVETPLVFVRGNCTGVWSSSIGQGVAFGFTLVDYVTKKPLIVCTITKNADKFDYKSITWDKETSVYIDGIISSKKCKDTNELLQMVTEKMNLDIDKFLLK
jgi:hypothetical protein